MSRESLAQSGAGDTPGSEPRLAPATPARTSSITARLVAPVRRLRHPTTALLVACLLLGTACGWWAWRSWTLQRQADALARTPRAAAVAIGPGSMNAESGRTRVAWTVVVDNPGRGTLRVRAPFPGQVGADVIAFLDARPRSAEIAPGERKEIFVETVIPCAGTAALRAPELLLRGADQQERAVPVTGALAVVVAACVQQPPATRALALTGTTRAGPTLSLSLRSPTGRAWHVSGVLADGVALSTAAVTVGADPVDLALTAPAPGPAACPTTWRTSGVPLGVEVVARSDPAPARDAGSAGDRPVTGESARIPVQVGLPLTRWLLDVACGPPGEGT